MGVTRQRCVCDPDAFPAFQLFILAIVRLAEPIALTSIFPYAWALIKHFRIGDESNASFYAGVLISAFSLAEAAMGMYWGGLSDRVGRKPVLLVGCAGTMLSMLVVGLASNIWVALAGRALGGFLNGNVGVIQTMVGELVTKPEHEPRAYAIMPFVWTIGTIIGPAIGGTFADPRTAFPNMFPTGSLFDRFPFLLPNLVCALLLLVSIVLGYTLLQETHPDLQPKTEIEEFQDARVSEETVLDLRAASYGTYGTFARGRSDAYSESSSTAGSSTVSSRTSSTSRYEEKTETRRQQKKQPKQPKQQHQSIFTRRIMAVVLALAIFTYHCMAYDATLPIFFEDARAVPFSVDMSTPPSLADVLLRSPGGLGLSLRAVGLIMAVNGVIALFVQAVVFPLAAAWMGVHRLFVLVTILHPLAYVLVPWLLYMPEGLLPAAIYACLTVRNVFAIIVYPLLLILIKEATPSTAVLGRVNGMAASAGAACRMVAPPIAGYLYTVGSRLDFTALGWYSAAAIAVVGAVQCFCVARPRGDKDAECVDYDVDENDDDTMFSENL